MPFDLDQPLEHDGFEDYRPPRTRRVDRLITRFDDRENPDEQESTQQRPIDPPPTSPIVPVPPPTPPPAK